MKEIFIDNLKYKIEKDQFLGIETVTLMAAPSNMNEIIVPRFIRYENRDLPVIRVGEKCFYQSKATTIVLPETIKSIGKYGFYCAEVKKITLPDSIIELGYGAFESCSNLEEINVPQHLKYIPQRCFLYDHKLHIKYLPSSIQYVDICGFQDVTFGELHFSSETKFIGHDAFRLAKVNMIVAEEGLKVVGPGAFRQNQLVTYLDLPSSVEELGNGFAHDCPSLIRLVIRAEEPPYTPNKMEHCNYFSDNMLNNLKVFVPKESVDRYKNDVGWHKVRNILPLEETYAK